MKLVINLFKKGKQQKSYIVHDFLPVTLTVVFFRCQEYLHLQRHPAPTTLQVSLTLQCFQSANLRFDRKNGQAWSRTHYET